MWQSSFLIGLKSKMVSKIISEWMKRAILFKPGFKAISFENIIKKMNIRLEPENKNGRGTNFSNFLIEKFLNYQNHS